MERLHGDLEERVAVATDDLPWVARDGFEERLLEVSDDRRTALRRIPTGGTVSVTGTGYIDLLILEGTLRDGVTTYPTRTFIRDRAGTQLISDGATVLLKHRFAGDPQPLGIDTTRVVFRPSDHVGVSLADLARDDAGAVVLMRLEPGAAIAPHRHTLGEEFFVLAGSLTDERGRYGEGHWVRQPPSSVHSIRSDEGALTFVFAHHLARPPIAVSSGLIVGKRYRLDEELHRGSTRAVFAATLLSSGERCAIKILVNGGDDPLAKHQFIREAMVGSSGNPHLPATYDMGELATSQLYRSMELLDGKLLKAPLAPQLAIDYVAQTCDALAALHDDHYVHRDLRPESLFLTTSGAIKLLSVGCVIRVPFPPQLQQADLVGSPAFMSPEQFARSRDIDGRSDLWSLGVTLYHLLSNRYPFSGRTLEERADATTRQPHAPLGDIPPALAKVIDRCLEKHPANRFATARELAAALRSV